MASQEGKEKTTTTESNEKTEQNKLIARYDQYFDLRTFSQTLRKTAKPVAKHRGKKQPILVVRRIIDYKGRLAATEVDIKSPALAEVLREINKDVDGLTLNKSPPVADPQLFFFSRFSLNDRLVAERAKDTPDEALISDLDIAMQFIEADHNQNIADYSLMTAKQEITYDLLWALLPPNALVYHFHQYTEQPQILKVKQVEYRRPPDRPDYAIVYCDIISNDGNFFGLAQVPIEIEIFTGARIIQDLPVFPLAFHEKATELREHSLKRGKRFVSMESYTYHEINGPVIQEQITQQNESYGRVMIDPVAFRRFEPNRNYNFSVFRRLDRATLTDEQLMICNPVVYGFCFGIKKWGGFAMDRLKDIVWSDEPFDFLVLGQKQKTLISALVRQHVTHNESESQFDDIVKGKGKGLVGLLSGRPGCGKTLTAEAIAEKTHRALYVVSAVGSVVGVACFSLTEAEVFLQRRDFTDLARNALVSIFLRQLEYYQGVLILTTNLLNHIDAAFESRIHFSIQYPDLDYNARRLIWNTFFVKVLGSSGAAEAISSTDLDRLAGYPLNGRQIKNMVGSAQAIALDNNASLTVEHVDTVLDVVNSWNGASSEDRLLDAGFEKGLEGGGQAAEMDLDVDAILTCTPTRVAFTRDQHCFPASHSPNLAPLALNSLSLEALYIGFVMFPRRSHLPLSAVSSVLSNDGGSVTVIEGHTITIPSGLSIPAIPTQFLSDTSLLDPLISSLTATLTGSLASEASSILNQVTGAAASAASGAASWRFFSASTTGSSGNGALSVNAGALGLMASVGAGVAAGMWLL
ncbi:hypothetical protein BT96DRAFT_1016993 [Gymnopus androsaceus JB14]|uniref:Uncharacterized protein n=1 Tax=Gymnopus androsaceus JB14 TaxID=1447944 RepID=A0A6A4I2M5_9AGAR|nr:hypothetical protein BT96DRAFT_1016993 [Gymnopus androsaceus JB14]